MDRVWDWGEIGSDSAEQNRLATGRMDVLNFAPAPAVIADGGPLGCVHGGARG